MKYIVAVFACLMLLATIAIPVNASAEEDTCAVLFDYGDGEIGWATIHVDPGMSAFNITEEAATQLGYQLTVSFWGESPFIDAINGHFPDYSNWSDMVYWGFYTWDPTSSSWQSSWVGPGDVSGEGLTAIAWSYTALPTATPDNPYPWTSFRGSAANSGSQMAYSPNSLLLDYAENMVSGSIESPIATANGLSYIVASGIVNNTTWGHDTNSTVFCLDENGTEVWSAEIGKGYQTSAPLIFNNKVIIASADGNVYAFDALTGVFKWSFDLGSGEAYGAPSPIGVTNRIYVASATGEIYSLMDNGDLDWNLSLGKSIYSSSPAVDYGMLFIGCEDGTLNAIDISTESLAWSLQIGGKVRGTPSLDDGNVIVSYINYTGASATSGGVAMVDMSGALVWQTETGVSPASVAMTDSGIVTIDSANLYMLDLDGEILWDVALGTMFSGGAPTYVNGTIFLVTNEGSGRLMAISEQGSIYINMTLEPQNYALCAPTVADGKLYISSDEGFVYVYDLNEVAPSSLAIVSDSDGKVADFDVSGVYEGTLFYYNWDFGDGNSSDEMSATHEYADAGTYAVRLTVSAPNGDVQTYDISIEVKEKEDSNDMVIWFIVIAAIVIVAVLAFIMLRRRK